MKSKKILMIALLVGFLLIIGIIIVNINNTSTELLSNDAANDSNSTLLSSSTTNNSGVVRKSSGKVSADVNNMVEITDNYFIQQTNDVYYNLDDYIGKTIKIEGFINSYNDSPSGDICYAVIRNAPGCCGDDGMAGLDIRYDGEYPEENTWVEIVGVMGTDTVYGSKIPAIQVVSITETEEGLTFVSN